jgi:catalase (peroxidase I)
MNSALIQFRIAPALKRSFGCAARFRHQSLSQFLIQAGIAAVESARLAGLAIKTPPTPRDGRKRHAKNLVR